MERARAQNGMEPGSGGGRASRGRTDGFALDGNGRKQVQRKNAGYEEDEKDGDCSKEESVIPENRDREN